MKLAAVSIGTSEPVPGRKSTRTGIFKHPVEHPVMVGREGLAGDRIINRKYHGGPEQAVYIEGSVDLDWWSNKLGRPIPPGTFGENLTIEGLANRDLAVGDRLRIGDVLIELTSPRTPCATFSARMGDPGFVKRYWKAGRPGAYGRVLAEGVIRAGQEVTLTPFPGERVTMAELMQSLGNRVSEEDRRRYNAVPLNARFLAMLEG